MASYSTAVRCFLLLYCAGQTDAGYFARGLPNRTFVKTGNINIGFLIPMSSITTGRLCNDTLEHNHSVIYTQAVEYAVNTLNTGKTLPNDVTLGFVILDDCKKESAAAVQSLAFVPMSACSSPPTPKPGELPNYDVVGVIGGQSSDRTMAVAYVLGPPKVPFVGYLSIDDELSNKQRFPYFLRTVSSESFQIRALVPFLRHYNWTYVSVLYKAGERGETYAKLLRATFMKNGICLATTQAVENRPDRNQAKKIVHQLMENKKARVVVLAFNSVIGKLIIEQASQQQPRHFVWIGNRGWTINQELKETSQNGMFILGSAYHTLPSFSDVFKSRQPGDTSDPWFKEFWERSSECSVANNTYSCTLDNYQLPSFAIYKTGLILDTIYMMTNATARVLSNTECHGLTGASARRCVTGPKLLKELKATRQQGYTGWIQVDEKGDRIEKFIMRQLVPGLGVMESVVAEIDLQNDTMIMVTNVTWAFHELDKGLSHPVSACTMPCGPKQVRSYEGRCCWTCLTCDVNEYRADNDTQCKKCQVFFWPDSDSKFCKEIPPDTEKWDTDLGICKTTVAVLLFLLSVAVFLFFYRHRHCRIIIDTSLELSYLMLLGIILGCITMVMLNAYPHDYICRADYLLFCTSSVLINAPLLVRALQIYVMLLAKMNAKTMPLFTEASYELLLVFALLSVQGVLCAVTLSVNHVWYKKTMSVATDPYVELSCDMPTTGMVSYLAYNVLLVSFSAFLSFKTRSVLDNFKETRFISMCSAITMVIVISCIPLSMLLARYYLRTLLLTLTLGLMHTAALALLFVPKVYAIYNFSWAAEIIRPGLTMNTLNSAVSSGLQGRNSSIDSTIRAVGDGVQLEKT